MTTFGRVDEHHEVHQPQPQDAPQQNRPAQQRRRPDRNDALDALKPQFLKRGPRYKDPLASRRDLTDARASLGQMHRLVHQRYQYKTSRRDATSKLRWIKRWWKNKEVKSLASLQAKVEDVQSVLDRFEAAAKDYEALRNRPVPLDTTARTAYFDELRAAARKLDPLDDELYDASTALKQEMQARKQHVLATRRNAKDGSWLRFGRRTQSEVLGNWQTQVEKYGSFTQSASANPADGYNARTMHEIARIDDLERKLAQVEADGGDITAILGTGDRALRTSVALQALRAAEPLSPLLKDTLGQDAVKGPVTMLGAGAFNEVRQTQLEFKDANGNTVSGRFALTRLDTRINQAGGAALRGQSSQQTRAFARHAAAFEISEALGLKLVGEPRLITVDGELSMAVPIAPATPPAI